jgi:hypothetical protein
MKTPFRFDPHDIDGHYTLVGQTPVEERDLYRWAEWFEHADRVVYRDQIGDIVISTVFLALDHRFCGKGPPLLFETMVFRNGNSKEQWRCATWPEAEKQHKRAVEEMRTKWMTEIIPTMKQ